MIPHTPPGGGGNPGYSPACRITSVVLLKIKGEIFNKSLSILLEACRLKPSMFPEAHRRYEEAKRSKICVAEVSSCFPNNIPSFCRKWPFSFLSIFQDCSQDLRYLVPKAIKILAHVSYLAHSVEKCHRAEFPTCRVNLLPFSVIQDRVWFP